MGGKKAKSDAERSERRNAALKKANEKYYDSRLRINITLTQEEYRLLKKAAEEKGVTPTTFAHDATIKAAGRR